MDIHNWKVWLVMVTFIAVVCDMAYGFYECRKIHRKLNEVIAYLNLGLKLDIVIEKLEGIRNNITGR